jgi:hypothetical protein
MNGKLRVHDVDRWEPESLRQVARAARLRAEASESAAQGLTNLPGFGPGDGPSAASAQAIAQTRDRLAVLAAEAHEVAVAADTAAAGVEDLKNRLAVVRAQASSQQLRIDVNTDAVILEPAASADGRAAASTVDALQGELDAIVAQVNRIDQNLARAIEAADHRCARTGLPAAEAS